LAISPVIPPYLCGSSAGVSGTKYCSTAFRTDLNSAPRSTRSALTQNEAHQSGVIASLAAGGHLCLAVRLARCQYDRQHREAGRYPWRCRSAGCWGCRRSVCRRWWKSFERWLAGPEVSLVIIPLIGDSIAGIRKLRKALRDARDRAARDDARWRHVAFGGMLGEDRMLMLVQHTGISREDVCRMLERRWSDVVVTDPDGIVPFSINQNLAEHLARCRRGIEPIRIVIPMQRAGAMMGDEWDEPMPFLF
jgi:hypothetical protein